jgi:uncharacterized protein YbcI
VNDGAPSSEQVKDEIAREISRVHLDAYGEPVSNLEVAIHDGFVAVMMEIELSRAEETLIDAGSPESVKVSREAFQGAIEATFTAIVERATGRRVTSFASRTVVLESPPWSVEVFRFA